MSLANSLRRLLFLEQWCIGYARLPIAEFLAAPRAAKFTWIRPTSKREFLADPFGLERNGALQILAERLVQGEGPGEIVEIAERANNLLLRKPFHLSYPFPIEDDDGTVYVVPEQAEAGALSFYRLTKDGLDTQAVSIAGLDAIDPTFLRHDGRWWLFCARGTDPNGALHLFYADRLLGPYQPHKDNPIVRDRSCARPAGRIIHLGEKLIRPGQDCRAHYGAALMLSEIDTLSVDRYRERNVGRITPGDIAGAFADGVHTLDHTPNYVLIDSLRFLFHPLAWLIHWRERRQQRQRKSRVHR